MTIFDIEFNDPDVSFFDTFGCNILISKSEKSGNAGFAIVLEDNIVICIDPTNELMLFCNGNEIRCLNSKEVIETPISVKISYLKITKGCYVDDTFTDAKTKNYFYIQPRKILFIFDVNAQNWVEIIKKLDPKLICLQNGTVLTQTEAFIRSLI